HANYGVSYEVEIPLFNNLSQAVDVEISFDSPIRIPENTSPEIISFYQNPPARINFRGEFKAEYKNLFGRDTERYIHIVQRFGQKSEWPLATVHLEPGEQKTVKISYIYPADATPPHVLTIRTK